MNYTAFQEQLKPFTVFSINEIEKQFPGFDSRRLVEWQAKGYLVKLRNRYYCFANHKVAENSLSKIANVIYKPSYVSLETTLMHYGFIPEGVFKIVSCTTLKTQTFSTPLGDFVYRCVKPKLFFGYRLEAGQDFQYALAGPEKTLIDYLYLHPEIRLVADLQVRRWNKSAINQQIKPKKLMAYETLIASPALSKRLKILLGFLNA